MTDAPILAPRRLDRHFRWRGTETSRLEGFSDAVFAIVLALLFLRSAPPQNFHDLKAAMRSLLPFAATFAIIVYVWCEHWLFTRRYDLRDPAATVLNMLLLFLLLGYAYPLKFLFMLLSVAWFGPIGELDQRSMLVGFTGEHDLAALFVFYGVGYGAIFGTIALLYVCALRRRAALGLDEVELFLTRSAIVQALLQVGIASLSVLLAAIGVGLEVGVPGLVYGLLGIVMWVHGLVEGRGVQRRLRAVGGGA